MMTMMMVILVVTIVISFPNEHGSFLHAIEILSTNKAQKNKQTTKDDCCDDETISRYNRSSSMVNQQAHNFSILHYSCNSFKIKCIKMFGCTPNYLGRREGEINFFFISFGWPSRLLFCTVDE